jgi:hypothetical protein
MKSHIPSFDDTLALFEPEEVVTNGTESSINDQTIFVPKAVQETTHIQEQDHIPSPKTPQVVRQQDVDDQNGGHAPSPQPLQEECGPTARPQVQPTRLRGMGRRFINTAPTVTQPRLGRSTAHQLLASFLTSQPNGVIQPIDMSTNEGKNRGIQFR